MTNREDIIAMAREAGISVDDAWAGCPSSTEIRRFAALVAAASKAEEPVNLADIIEGMSVSVDVSMGEADAGHRYFGTVTEVMEDPNDKHGLTLLVQDAKPNFDPPAQRKPWVGLTDEEATLIQKQTEYTQDMSASLYAARVKTATEAKLKEKNT